MRGKDNFEWGGYVERGITPAYAGKRTQAYCSVVINKDHPRLCGEKQAQAACSLTS